MEEVLVMLLLLLLLLVVVVVVGVLVVVMLSEVVVVVVARVLDSTSFSIISLTRLSSMVRSSFCWATLWSSWRRSIVIFFCSSRMKMATVANEAAKMTRMTQVMQMRQLEIAK